MSKWRELTWDDAIQRGYEALAGGEARYEEVDTEQGRSNIDIESTCGSLTRTSPERMPGMPWRGSWAGDEPTTAVRRAERHTCPPPADQHRLWSPPERPSLVSIPDLGSQSRSDSPAWSPTGARSLAGNAADWSCWLVGRVVGA